jgi:selenocysteine lyase/cysteine desulfurase
MLGVLYGKKALLDKLDPYRVETNKNETPFKYEQGMLNNVSLAGLEAALDYLLWLEAELFGKSSGAGARRPRFQRVMGAIEDYERGLSRIVLEGFRRFDPNRFRCHGLTDPSRCEERDPTFAFEVEGLAPADIKRRLWEESAVQIADGNHYSAAVFRHLGRPALCRASFAHYDNAETARTFLKAMGPLIERKS